MTRGGPRQRTPGQLPTGLLHALLKLTTINVFIIHSVSQSVIQSVIYSFIHPSIHSFVHSFIHLFIYLFIIVTVVVSIATLLCDAPLSLNNDYVLLTLLLMRNENRKENITPSGIE